MPCNRIGDCLRGRDGNVAVMTALFMPLCAGLMALGVDFGHLALERRQLQTVADLASIAVASNLANAEQAAMAHLQDNGVDVVVKTPRGWIDASGQTYDEASVPPGLGRVTIEKGRYVADRSADVALRFTVGAQPHDGARVTVQKAGTLFFAGLFTTAPIMAATGTSAAQKQAGFSIGSRLASLDGGLLNAILSQMLGTTISLKAVDYRLLAAADVGATDLAQGLMKELSLTTATYEDLLDAEISVAQLLGGIARAPGLSSPAGALLRSLVGSLPKSGPTFKLSSLLDLGSKEPLRVQSGSGLQMKLGLLDLLQASAALASGGKLVSVETAAGLPGLGKVDLALAIGEPPVGTPPNRFGTLGDAVRTSQVRLAATVTIDGLAELAGIKIRLPLYLEVAHAEAKLADIQCHSRAPANATVILDAVPGVAELSIGDVDPTVLRNFGRTPRVTKARLVDSGLLSIDGIAQTDVGALKHRRLSFSPTEIAVGTTKTVSSDGMVTSATQSLLSTLEVDIRILFLSVGSPKLIQAALAKTLAAATPSLDALIDRLLATAGVRVGEADLRVTGVSCSPPVLVQ